MIVSFSDQGTTDVFDGKDTKAARASCPQQLWPVARRKLDQIDNAAHVIDLSRPPGNRLQPLHGDRKGQLSIRINDQYRICFRWSDDGAHQVEIVDYH